MKRANGSGRNGNVRASFEKARNVNPEPLTGRETPSQVIERAFNAFVGRQERQAYELMRQCVTGDYTVFLTMSGAMTPAGLHQSCVIPLIERGIISSLTTTGANLYHDAHRVIGHAIREVNPDAGDLQLRLARIIRIYDLGFWEETLLDTDRLFSQIVRGPDFQRKMTTPEFHWLLGREMDRIERALKCDRPSLLSSCYRAGIPIFVGAVQDGSIFLNVVKLKKVLGDDFKLEIDVTEDVYAMAAFQHWARHHGTKRLAIWILGGGVPKNYTLQGEPLLDQILFVPTKGFDIDIQFCVDPVDNGALSSCPASEGHTWGKVSAECVEEGTVYCHCDVTAVFPWLTHALLSDAQARLKPRRMMDHMKDALAFLDADVRKNRKLLEPTMSYEVAKPGKARSSKGAGAA